MIRVSPTKLKPPKALLEKWKQEKEDAIKAFAKGLPAKFEFEAYKLLKDELLRVFEGKCAYCESQILAVGFGDVEHFRPKAFVQVNKEKKCGYYWLAGETSNLLLACSQCNTAGKRNEFPLADESKRASTVGAEANEDPLLLNPYTDEPEKYLLFAASGEVSEVPTAGIPRKKATESIRVYGLNRDFLVRPRGDHVTRVRGVITHVLERLEELKQKFPVKEKLARDWNDLCNLLQDHMPYLALTRQLIADLIAPNARKEIERITGKTMD